MIEMLHKRHEIQMPRRARPALEELVSLAGVSQSSVQRVEPETPVCQAPQRDQQALLRTINAFLAKAS